MPLLRDRKQEWHRWKALIRSEKLWFCKLRMDNERHTQEQ